jgi:hypothetical protein
MCVGSSMPTRWSWMVGGSADTSFADLEARPRWQHGIDQGDLLELGEDLSRFVAESSSVAPRNLFPSRR